MADEPKTSPNVEAAYPRRVYPAPIAGFPVGKSIRDPVIDHAIEIIPDGVRGAGRIVDATLGGYYGTSYRQQEAQTRVMSLFTPAGKRVAVIYLENRPKPEDTEDFYRIRSVWFSPFDKDDAIVQHLQRVLSLEDVAQAVAAKWPIPKEDKRTSIVVAYRPEFGGEM